MSDVLDSVVDRAVELLDADGAGVTLAAKRGELAIVSANAEFAIELERVQQQSSQGPCHEVFRTGEVMVIDDISAHDEWPIYVAAAREFGVRSVMGMPLQVGERSVGALDVYSSQLHKWSDDDVMAARALANVATTYILHATELERSNRLNDRLHEALGSLVVIEQAKGILSGENGIDLDHGFELLRTRASNSRSTLRSVAEAVVNDGLRLAPAT